MTDAPSSALSGSGEEAWRLRKKAWTMACVLRPEESAGSSWNVVLTLDGKSQFGRRWPNEALARFAAESLKQDHLRGGWTE